MAVAVRALQAALARHADLTTTPAELAAA
jgi:hypothetical protein